MSARNKGSKWFGRHKGKGTKSPQTARTPRLLGLELLEDRTLPSISVLPTTAAPAWTDLGPTSITGGQVEGLGNQSNPVTGAVVAFAKAPNSNAVFAATANGGVWATDDITRVTRV